MKFLVFKHLHASPRPTTIDLCNIVGEQSGHLPSFETVRKYISAFRRGQHRYGLTLQGLLNETLDKQRSGEKNYIKSINDERKRYIERSAKNRIGVIIFMSIKVFWVIQLVNHVLGSMEHFQL